MTIEQTGEWFFAANQQPSQPTPNVRQVTFYIGMQLEELGEKLTVLSKYVGSDLRRLAKEFKTPGMWDHRVAQAMKDPAAAKELFDADLDLIWVSIGAGRALGSDVPGGYAAVTAANWNKRWPDGDFHNDPATNKVLKPEGWPAPDLTAFMHPTMR